MKFREGCRICDMEKVCSINVHVQFLCRLTGIGIGIPNCLAYNFIYFTSLPSHHKQRMDFDTLWGAYGRCIG